mmetsp:Transcript_69691/g.179664  ORF Transcript_69691/g.179664 Transcript_69691/m.179664 type:complete len:1020 (+) Transcript_69691:88-3147(+)
MEEGGTAPLRPGARRLQDAAPGSPAARSPVAAVGAPALSQPASMLADSGLVLDAGLQVEMSAYSQMSDGGPSRLRSPNVCVPPPNLCVPPTVSRGSSKSSYHVPRGIGGTYDSIDKALAAPGTVASPLGSRRSSLSTTMPSLVGEAARQRLNMSASSSSGESHKKRRHSLGSGLSLATLDLDGAPRQAVQVNANDLGKEGVPDTSADGIQKVISQECLRMSCKVASKAYENDLRGTLAERKLMRSNSKSSLSVSSPSKRVDSVTSIAPGAHDRYSGDSETDCDGANGEVERMNSEMRQYIGWASPIKWLLTVVVAVVIAMQAGAIIHGTYRIVEWKMGMLAELCATGQAGQFYAFCLLVLYACLASLVASSLVTYVAPHAGGSGIPEIKAFLNGITMPKGFTVETWYSRSIGLMLVTSAGLFAGTEGPFAHLGGMVAKFFADGPNFGVAWPSVLFGHRNRCEFISQGAAMGVAAAFGAPIGGILFSLEEASTFWSKALTWRAFLGTVVAALLAKLAKSGFTTFVVSGFVSFPDLNVSFSLWELGTFAPLAVVQGLLGALFCNTVKGVLQFRRRFFKLGAPTRQTKLRRLLEVQCIALLTMSVCFWPAVLLGCREVPAVDGARRLGGALEDGPPVLTGGICPQPQVEGMEAYSDLGYILLSPKEGAIRTLFSEEMAGGAYMSIPSLLIAWGIVFFTTICTFGSAIPVGLFIPNILAGACLGRAFGQALLNMDFNVHPGVYALMGAAGALGGFSRMTISLAVIFLEITNNMNLLMPLMLVIMISKVVADQFGPSVYDIVLDVNPDIHLLEDHLSEDHLLVLNGLKVHDVCTSEIVVLRGRESISEIMKLLEWTTYGGFPIVDDDGMIDGLITRTQLVQILDSQKEAVGLDQMISLLKYANTAPDITVWSTPVVNAFHHFRSCGLQHLCVVDQLHRVVGILTRTDFAMLCRHCAGGPEEVRALIQKGKKSQGGGKAAAARPVELTTSAKALERRLPAEDGTSSAGSRSDLHGDSPVKTHVLA